MTAYKSILGIVPTMQSVALASSAYKAAKKKKCRTKCIMKSSMNAIVGANMIKATAQTIGGID